MHNVDNDPDNPGLISRKFVNPFKRLEDISRRIEEGKYLAVTICGEHNPKYLFELYYDFVFLNHILANLGLMSKVSSNSQPEPFTSSVNSVIHKIVETIKSDNFVFTPKLLEKADC